MAIEKDYSGKPKDTIEVIEKTPKCRVFRIKPGEPNEEYETLMKRLISDECESVGSSGRWSNEKDEYLVQVHYFEIKKIDKKREDTDFETDKLTDEMKISKKSKEEKEKLEKEESDEIEATVKMREGALEFDGLPSVTGKKIKKVKETVDANNA